MTLNYRIFGVILLLSLLIISGANAIAPVANFTSNTTTNTTYPLVVQFNDNSTTGGVATTWNWSFGDGRWFNTTNPLLKNATYQYAVAGKYNVSLLVNNTDGSNITTKTDYINLTADADSFLVSWLHMNGTSGSVNFTGEEGLAWTTFGTAHITNVTYVFTNSSGDFTQADRARIFTPSSNSLNLTTNDFTLEFWLNVTTLRNNRPIISKSPAGSVSSGWGVTNINSTANGYVFWWGNSATAGNTTSFNVALNTWTHIAIERIGTTVFIYKNGILVATGTGMTGSYDSNNSLSIGDTSAAGASTRFYMDEFRLSNGVGRWTSDHTTPYREYRGILETIFPDINPGSTFRYKTDPTGNAYIDNLTPRNRTLQIQNITNTSYVTGEILFDPIHGYVKSVQLNNSYFPTGLTLVSSSIDNTAGTIIFNISRAAGFNTSGTNRASILDYTMVYYNFSDGHDITTQFFGFGFLINGTTNKFYPIHNFLGTPITYGDWNFTANFVADNLTPSVGNLTTFTSSFTGSYPNRWNWSFGDGTFNDGENSTVSHVYTTGGLKTVTLMEYMWQSDAFTVNSSITRTNYINVQEFLPIADFNATLNSSTVPVRANFTDNSTNNPTSWEWFFGDGNTSNVQNPVHIYEVCGDFTVGLRSMNTAGWSNWTNKTNYINVTGCPVLPPVADFNSTNNGTTVPVQVNFTDNSTDTPTSWEWFFGDGNTSTVQNPIHIYEVCGDFTVGLRSMNVGGWSNWTNKTDYVNVTGCPPPVSPPVADFSSVSNGTHVPVEVIFDDLSTNSPTAWEWHFGDGNISIVQNPTHIYEVCGDFTVSFKSWNAAGWSNWNNKTNYVTVTGCVVPTPTSNAASKIATKVSDTQNLIIIGVILIIVAGLAAFLYGLLTRK